MEILVVTPTRLLGDGLIACLTGHAGLSIVAVVGTVEQVPRMVAAAHIDLILIDVTLGIDLYEVHSLALQHRDLVLVALGLAEHREDVVRCGRAGFAGYVPRSATSQELCEALLTIGSGRLACSAEISCSLMRALFCSESHVDAHGDSRHDADPALTQRESEVLQMIGQGLSNKEIARALSISVATVKNHVHKVLEKLHLPCRARAMRCVRDAPWLAPTTWSAQHDSHTRAPEERRRNPGVADAKRI